jgi:glycosyltransferase involved in cell wall biosynthesis
LLADPAARTRMGGNGRAAITSQFNWDRSAEAVLGVYRSVLSARGADTSR